MRVVGIDLAQNSTGITAVDIRDIDVIMSGGPVEVLFETHVSCDNDTPSRILASQTMCNMSRIAKPDLVVIEDYTRQAFSYVSFSTGELSGMLRLRLWDEGIDQLFVVPGKLKMFLRSDKYDIVPKSKGEIAFLADKMFGYRSKLHYKREREDATDAFVLAVIGYVRLALKSESEILSEWLSGKQRKVFYGDKGLLDDKFVLEGKR